MVIQSAAITFSMLFVNSYVNTYGTVAVAVTGVSRKIEHALSVISHSLSSAGGAMVSQALGAGKTERVPKIYLTALWFAAIPASIFALVTVTHPEWLFGLFSDDPAVHEMSTTFISAILWMFPAFAVMRGSGAFIQGLGHAKLSMVLAILDGVVLRIGLSWLFGIALNMGFFGFVLGYGLAPYGYAIPSLIYFLSGIWKKRRTLADEM
jgi:Na+-driven multidrug efflux pump